jgi:hypothetical protein
VSVQSAGQYWDVTLVMLGLKVKAMAPLRVRVVTLTEPWVMTRS